MTAPIVAFSERLAPLAEHEAQLRVDLGADVLVVPMWTVDEIVAWAGSADALVVGAVEPLTREAMEALKRCRVIVRRGVGVDNVDLDAATDLGIPIAFVPDASVPEVSDHALALVLALERKLVALDAFVKAGEWTHATSEIAAARKGMRRLAELTLGIVGFGRIGREFARKATPLFERVVVFDPFVSEEPLVDLVDFQALLATSDVISLHSPLTQDTAHLFDAAAFRAMKPGSTLVNTSRGALIDTSALIAALRSGSLRGAGLDVTETEPIELQSDLLALDNVVLTGHSAASSDSSAAHLRAGATGAVMDALQGRHPAFIANEAVFARPTCRLTAQGVT
jgi:D-3-phosphoglycerate dehydrogenase